MIAATVTPLIKAAELIEQVKLLLGTDQIARTVGGQGRVYRIQDNFTQPEDVDTKPWGRIIIQGTQVVWGNTLEPALSRQVSFLIRVEANDYVSPGYDVSYILEGAHQKAYELLEGFAPVLTESVVTRGVWLNRGPQTTPLWDESRRLWFMSAEYRAELGFKR